jgi:hypothetical protein
VGREFYTSGRRERGLRNAYSNDGTKKKLMRGDKLRMATTGKDTMLGYFGDVEFPNGKMYRYFVSKLDLDKAKKMSKGGAKYLEKNATRTWVKGVNSFGWELIEDGLDAIIQAIHDGTLDESFISGIMNPLPFMGIGDGGQNNFAKVYIYLDKKFKELAHAGKDPISTGKGHLFPESKIKSLIRKLSIRFAFSKREATRIVTAYQKNY